MDAAVGEQWELIEPLVASRRSRAPRALVGHLGDQGTKGRAPMPREPNARRPAASRVADARPVGLVAGGRACTGASSPVPACTGSWTATPADHRVAV